MGRGSTVPSQGRNQGCVALGLSAGDRLAGTGARSGGTSPRRTGEARAGNLDTHRSGSGTDRHVELRGVGGRSHVRPRVRTMPTAWGNIQALSGPVGTRTLP